MYIGYYSFYGLTLIGLVFTLISQWYVNHNYKKYLKVKNSNNLRGCDVARKILDLNGLNDVKVQEVSGVLTDHYDPKSKVVRLSSTIYNETSISSVAVAAHECGHAIQDKNGYFFLRLRSSLVPLTNLCTKLGYIIIIVGLIFSMMKLFMVGIVCELVILLFQVITLPVEFNASNRALKILNTENIVVNDEVKMSKKVLKAAALTYVAAVATNLLELLRLILIFNNRD